jgi:drug/metabolite transporter (DMT)-like permease
MKARTWAALVAVYIVWGSTYLAIRFAVETIPPFMHASIRFLISGVILFLWRRAAGDSIPTTANWKSLQL